MIKKANGEGQENEESQHFGMKTKIEQTIEQTKGLIAKTKNVNKQIKQKNKTLGDSIHFNDDFMDNMHKLELQVQLVLRRKDKINERINETESANKNIKIKLSNIQNQFEIAEKFLAKNSMKEK